MRKRTQGFLAAVVLGTVALLVAASGILPIGAASGHWDLTEWFLHFSMRRSISTYSLSTTVPPLDDPSFVVRGAGHYETGCRPCHGGPGSGRPEVPGGMTPHPPYLPLRIDEWEPEELFRIVERGIKFTGMPAWPSQSRPDEVWAVVAFLEAFPTMSEAEYRRLALGEDADGTADPEPALGLAPTLREGAGARMIENCARCHGRDGGGRGGAAPRLAGQSAEYVAAQLRAYATGRRESGIMMPVAAVLSEEAIADLARHYAGLPAPPSPSLGGEIADLVRRGETIAHDGIPEKKVPSCVDCHGPTSIPRHPAYPDLAGQYPDYLVLQLQLFREGHRGGSSFHPLMEPVVERLDDDDMAAVAAYYASLGG